MLFDGRNRIRFSYSRYGYTRGNGKIWHGGADVDGLDDSIIHFPSYYDKEITGTVTTARIVTDKRNRTWEWGYYVCVKLDANQTPDPVNYLYFCHCEKILVKVGQKVKSGDAIAVMGNTGNAALANPPFKHCHFEVRASSTGKGLDPTAYIGFANAVGVYDSKREAEQETLIDVSKYQGKIDWKKVPYRALVRIGYRGYGSGTLCKDERFDENLSGAKNNDKLFGFYFFSQAVNESEAKAEAEYCASLAPSGYPLFFDAEWSHEVHDGRADSISKDVRTACARAFCKRATELGFIAGVYTFTNFAGVNVDYEGLCKDYIGWLADYQSDYDKTLPRHIHQYTSDGSVAGISERVDMNHLVKEIPTESQANKPVSARLQTITIGPVSQGDADAIYLLAKELGLTEQGLYKSEWVE